MSVKFILNEIEEDVQDVLQTKFEYINTNHVPNLKDGALTYEAGKTKTGKIINTCVLYVDIRNSVDLTHKYTTESMGMLYTAFTKAVLKVAKHHNGHTRNIIGDRVMIVFPSENCFTNAVDCAVSINHIAKKIVNVKFTGMDFKCGIGIDYGELKVIKVGIQRRGDEHGENKGLIWVGYPANISSRLTDVANKTIQEIYVEVVRYPINLPGFLGLSSLINNALMSKGIYSQRYIPSSNEPVYSPIEQTVEIPPEEFVSKISITKESEISMTGGKLIRFANKTRSVNYPPILMTEEVFKGFKKENPTRDLIVNNYLKELTHKIKNVTDKIYGVDVHWVIN